MIKNDFPKLYEALSINAVVDPESDYKKIFEFFRKNQSLCEYSKIRFNELSQNYTENNFVYNQSYYAERNYDALKAYLLLLGRLDGSLIGNFKTEIEEVFSYNEVSKPLKEPPTIAHPGGTCIPGLKKLFVDVDGNFYPCERIDEKSSLMNIGNIYDGFNISKIR